MCFSNITITLSVYQMTYENYFEEMFESIPDYRKIVLLKLLFQNDDDLLKESAFLEVDINRLNKELN